MNFENMDGYINPETNDGLHHSPSTHRAPRQSEKHRDFNITFSKFENWLHNIPQIRIVDLVCFPLLIAYVVSVCCSWESFFSNFVMKLIVFFSGVIGWILLIGIVLLALIRPWERRCRNHWFHW